MIVIHCTKWLGYLPTLDILSKFKYSEEEEKINVSLLDNLDYWHALNKSFKSIWFDKSKVTDQEAYMLYMLYIYLEGDHAFIYVIFKSLCLAKLNIVCIFFENR